MPAGSFCWSPLLDPAVWLLSHALLARNLFIRMRHRAVVFCPQRFCSPRSKVSHTLGGFGWFIRPLEVSQNYKYLRSESFAQFGPRRRYQLRNRAHALAEVISLATEALFQRSDTRASVASTARASRRQTVRASALKRHAASPRVPAGITYLSCHRCALEAFVSSSQSDGPPRPARPEVALDAKPVA